MSDRAHQTLLLALGNDILGDDGVAFYAARILGEDFGATIDIEESAEAGLALMELMEGYRRVLLMDAIVTGQHQPGTVVEFSQGDFRRVIAPSPHYAGLPEVLALAERIGIEFPSEFRILAMEVVDPYTLSEELTEPVEQALPDLVAQARSILEQWSEEELCTNTR